jgi:hypothetical protein
MEAMNDVEPPGIYLIVHFDWPSPFERSHGENARHLHDVVQGRTWIKEVLAASGGVGRGPSSVWVFWLQSYSSLDRLFRDQEDEVAKAYAAFFSEMEGVVDQIREEVRFR